jgi:SAM-dependent methyltransferase
MSVMGAYYRARAAEYDRFYANPHRLDELTRLTEWLIEHIRGRTILEIAAGTGYWTEVAASAARAVVATDFIPETLAIAAERPLGPHVTLLRADAYALPEFDPLFDVGMAHMWWSHVEKERQLDFLSQFVARLKPASVVLMIDQTYVEGICGPISRQDEWGNQYELRRLGDGSTYEIVKNYPTDEELLVNFAPFSDDVRIMRLRHFWALSAHNVGARSG